ncbi:MAG: transglutaminase family protein, partial [Gammaproteobacteria bacterium]|nr:transglutaminase family protein [Gammaproteobacteria bacterium]
MTALAAHDRAVAALGRPVWLGAEPTYTDPSSEAPEWLYEALGEDKLARARRMLVDLARDAPGAAVLRPVGRQYGGEPVPRWSLGLYARRDGAPVWPGPPDPLLLDRPLPLVAADVVARHVVDALEKAGCRAALLTIDDALPVRVAFRTDGAPPPDDVRSEPRLARPSVHAETVAGAAPRDTLAESGIYLLALGEGEGDDRGVLRIELPAFEDAGKLQWFLNLLGCAARAAAAPALVLAGYPPAVDDAVRWSTITADPAVLEVNMAPAAGAAELLADLRRLHAVAGRAGLAPYRLHYNGTESDSGGGGQVTLGGPSPETSPFLVAPDLLPRLLRYFNRHPSLSYLHAADCAGSASQAPRADEGVRESFRELALALALIEGADNPSPSAIWATLAPFLADPSGNMHRAEINIEKLWSESLGARGRQGLVEFRALRMGATPEATAALASLLRALVAMLAEHPYREPLRDWGDTLHDRFSLPFYLAADMREVLGELDTHHLGLAAPIQSRLLDDGHRLLAVRPLVGARLEIRRAVEFWPLVGDVATQEQGGSRLVDASTARIEVRLRASGEGSDLDGWRLSALGWDLPLREERDAHGPVRLVGLRYRSFAPWRGLHPTLTVQAPLELAIAHALHGAWRVTLHEWRPDGGPYAGLPVDAEEARARRDARCVLEP